MLQSVCSAQTNYISNGDFSSTSSGWQKAGFFQYDSRFSNYHSPYGYAYLANLNGTKGNSIAGSIYQDFFIPSSVTNIEVSFWFYITTDETTSSNPNDSCIVRLIDPLNNSYTQLIKLSNLDANTAYQKATFQILNIQSNKTWRLFFYAINDNTNPTIFRVDDVNVSPLPVVNMNCIAWANSSRPSAMVDTAMQKLCTFGIINQYQNANLLSGPIAQKEIAEYTCKALFGSTPLDFLDNFPTLFAGIENLSLAQQRYIKAMLYLEYKDDISPFSREYLLPNYDYYMKRSDALKTLIEAWNINPDMIYYDPQSTANSPIVCDIKRSYKNLGWLQRAKSLNILNGYVTTCSTNSINFGSDNNISYAEFYVLLSRILDVNKPIIGYDDFFKPNILRLENVNQPISIEKGVFQHFENRGFSIPSGGVGLDFHHTYYSNLTEIPVLNTDLPAEDSFLLSKLQPLGGGWTHTYSAFIKSLDNNGNQPKRILIYWPDGTLQSYLVQAGKYETKDVKDKLTINSYNNVNQPQEITIRKGRTQYIFKNIDPVVYNTLSLTSVIDARGNVLALEYIDGYGSVSRKPKILSKVTDSFSKRTLTFDYWSNSNYLKTVKDPIGRELHFYPNKYKNDLDSFSDAKNNTTIYSYKELVGSFAYRTHLLTKIKLPKGNEIDNSYISRKLKSSQTANYSVDVQAVPNYLNPWTQQNTYVKTTSSGRTTQNNYTYDTQGNIVGTTTETQNVQQEFDNNNRLTVSRDKNSGYITKYSYDNNGYVNKVVVIDSLFNDSIKYVYKNNQYGEVDTILNYNDQNWNVQETRIYRNANGDPTNIVENEGLGGEVRHQYYYNSNGLVNKYISPTGYNTDITYNSYGNIFYTAKIPNPPPGFPIIERYYYDSVSRLIVYSNAEEDSTQYTYDASDNIILVAVDPNSLNLKTEYTYDKNYNLIAVKSPKGHTTNLSYDFHTDNLTQESDGNNSKMWKYSDDGYLDTFINKNGAIFPYTYFDSSNFPNTPFAGMFRSDGRTFYSYRDNTKEPYLINNIYGKANHYWYDSRQRGKFSNPVSVSTSGFFSNSVADQVYYEYDKLNRVVLMEYPTMSSKQFGLIFTYDAVTRKVESVKNRYNNKAYVTYQYHKDGKTNKVIYGNGDTIHYHYDRFDRLDTLSAINKAGQLLYKISAQMDRTGRHTSENIQVYYNGVQDTTLPTITKSTSSYTYQTRNRILTGDGKSFTSTGAGEVDSSWSNPTNKYTWTDYGKLASVKKDTILTVYEYDALGNRKRKNNIYYVIDQENTGNPIIEATQGAALQATYVYGNGLVCRIDGLTDSVYYYHYDFRGSTIGITDDTGKLVKLYKYLPYGSIYHEAGGISWNNPYKYIGSYGVQTDDTDLCYMNARYYQPSTG
ncbi:MAG: hypothetical protein KDE33_12850, partial [Bacteroidetes bacterium]|nr:hypothetical protein [Bacteroidota bacterium]